MSLDRPFLGIDIGGTKLAVGIATADGRVRSHLRAPSRREDGPDAMIDRVIQMARTAVEEADLRLDDVEAIGIGCGGPLDPVAGIVRNALNNPGWIDIPIVERIESMLGRPAYLANDGNAAVLAEHRFGAGRGVHNLVYLTISTGVGGGVIANDHLMAGENGNGGELGHICVRAGGRPCRCGSRGCIEAYCSGTSIAERAREALDAGGMDTSVLAGIEPPIRAEDVVAAARNGDPTGRAVWEETVEMLGIGIVSIVNAFNPRLILLGGGVAQAGEMLLDPIRRIVNERAMPWLSDVVEVAPAQLGDSVGLLGAVATAVDRTDRGRGAWVADLSGPVTSQATSIGELGEEWDEHHRVIAAAASQLPQVQALADALCTALGAGHKLLIFGNGGSAAEAQHFAGELLGRFRATRRPLPAIALSTDPSTLTGIANDFGYDEIFARQVEALAGPGDIVIGITTSGRSENIVRGLRAARAGGAMAVAWTGADPGLTSASADMLLTVPSTTTARIQETHTLMMHSICVAVDAWLARPEARATEH